MVYFHTKNATFGTFGKTLGWKLLSYLTAIRYFIANSVNFRGNFGLFFPVWVCSAQKNLATLNSGHAATGLNPLKSSVFLIFQIIKTG
jgi:hypothetical protein